MRVWCFDPGETTGVFMASGESPSIASVVRAQVEYDRLSSWLYCMLEDADEFDALPDVIVIEQTNIYDRRAAAARKNILPTIEVQGFIVMLAKLYGVPTKYQWNRDKNQVSDDDLERLGILMRPKKEWRHANDAARHYAYYMNRKAR